MIVAKFQILIFCLPVFLARLLVLQENNEDSLIQEAHCFLRWREFCAKKTPYGFILENVEGLVTHDRENPQDKMGRTA